MKGYEHYLRLFISSYYLLYYIYQFSYLDNGMGSVIIKIKFET